MICVLDNLRSVYNVAACFRTADGAGVEKLYLVGTTPAPVDRWGRERKDFAKVALGAEKSVPFESADKIEEVLDKLKREGFTIVAVEQSKEAIRLDSFADSKKGKKNAKVVLFFGNEVEGLNKEILKKVDVVLEIPMLGDKESLNVAVAFGIAVYAFIGKV